jgi:adenylate cyclase
VPLTRVALSLPTLHPQYFGTGCRWLRESGQCVETLIGRAVIDSQMYKDSPLRRVYELGETVRRKLEGPDVKLDFPILAELRDANATDYIAMPLELSDGKRIAVTLATDAKGGFQRDHLVQLLSLASHVSPLIEIQLIRRITGNVLEAYLGRQSGQRVLAGEIVRGRGELIRAVIWLCDIRNFTPLSERLPGERVIAILDACFERVVDAVHKQGGEVLKFMGDGLLAIFPMPDAAFAPDATGRALDAAVEALSAVDGLTGSEALEGEPAPRMCVSLHVGDIMYGNIGSADRLDFTAIGPAVNLVSRLDQLSKTLNKRILVTGEFADVSTRKLTSLGQHPLRGLSGTYEIFTPVEAQAAV